MPSFRFIARIAMVVMVLAGWAWAQSDNDTLADVASRKPSVRARRVITNDDIPSRPQPDPAPASAKQQGAPSSADAKHDTAGSLAKVGLDRSSDEDVRQAVEQIRKQEIALQEKLNRIKDKLAAEDDDFRRQMWADALENQKTTLEQFRKVRERMEQPSAQGKPQVPAAPGS